MVNTKFFLIKCKDSTIQQTCGLEGLYCGDDGEYCGDDGEY